MIGPCQNGQLRNHSTFPRLTAASKIDLRIPKYFVKLSVRKLLAVEIGSRVQPCPGFVGVPSWVRLVAPCFAKLSDALSNAVRRAVVNKSPLPQVESNGTFFYIPTVSDLSKNLVLANGRGDGSS